jgi:hypothetical protein
MLAHFEGIEDFGIMFSSNQYSIAHILSWIIYEEEKILFPSPFANAPAFDYVLDGGNERRSRQAWDPEGTPQRLE